MSFYQDKQVRHFCFFLLSFALSLFLCGLYLNTVQSKAVQNLFLQHDKAVVTSLLEQGVPKNVIANSITNTASSEEGSNFLTNIGITEQTDIEFLPFIVEFHRITNYSMLYISVFLLLLLFIGTYIFLQKRELLYQQAIQVITHFTKGDFSCHLPQTNEGTLYRLFATVDQLSTILQSKNETELKAKEFLRNTISDISHQLKTPLTALTMYHEIILDEPENVNTVKEYSKKTGLALKRMEQLIQSMLKITRLDAGNIIFQKDYCLISELISQSISELTTRAVNEGKEIVIDTSLDETIICDKHWTSEALGNIVKNSLDHTAYGGTIHISSEYTPAMTRIFISDNGTGIAPEDLHHVFKRFYRSKNSLDTQGVGLGLSLSKSIIEGQNGIICVQSSVGEGTTFVISFLTKL